MATKKVILKEIVDGVAGDSIYPQTSKDMVEGLQEALDAAGSVSTISVNNGTPIQPINKNINITVPSEVTESTVSSWGFTKNAGTYSKPSGGIPPTDLASAVQTSLGKADTALQSYTETDPTVPSWAKQSTKPSYTASEVGALPDTYIAPVTSVNGQTGAVSLTIPDVSGKADKVVVVNAATLPASLEPNKVYQMGTLTGSVTIPAFASVTSGDTEVKIWCFTFSTSSTAPTITWPAGITAWNGGDAPEINADKSYEVSVMDGIGAIIEA